MAAEIPRAALDALTEQVNAPSDDAKKKVMKLLEGIDWENRTAAECRAEVVEAMRLLLPAYADASAQAAADYYDAARELAMGKPLGAVAESGLNLDATEGAIRAFVRFAEKDGNPERFNRHVCDRIDWELKRAATNSALANGRRDPVKPRFARVPAGKETCRFCLMLASRGFVYRAEATAGMNHVHPSCDCRTVPGWKGMSVEGYDPDALYDEWKHPKADSDPGVTWHQSIEEIDMPSGVSGRTLGKRTCSVYATSDGKRFIFPENMDSDKQGMTPKRAIRLYGEVPASVRNKMQNAIYFVDYENPQDSYWRKRYKKFTKSYATGGQEITFYSHACHDDDYVIRTYCHEAGHYIDGLTAIYRDRYSDEKSWVEAMVRDCAVSGKSNPTAYAKNSKAEDFAESMAEYCVNKVQFEAEYPNRAAILNAILGW